MKQFFMCACIIMLSSSNSSLCSIKSLMIKMTSFLKQVKSKTTSFLKQAKSDLEQVNIGEQSRAYIEQCKTLRQNWKSMQNGNSGWNNKNYGKSLLTAYGVWKTTQIYKNK